MPSGGIERKLGDTELREWLDRVAECKESGKPCGMSVSCPICWLPMSLNSNGASSSKGCPCGTIATTQELKEAFGLGHLSGDTTTAIAVRD